MTRTEFSKIILLLNAAYKSKDGAMIADKMQADMWFEMLQDLEYEICTKAVRNLVARSPYQPHISDIRSEYARLIQKKQPSEQEAWAIVREAIRDSYYHASEHFDEFPEIIKKAVVDPGQLREWGQCKSEQVDTVIQSLFKRNYNSVLERERDEAVIGLIGAKDGAYAITERNVERLGLSKEDDNDC